MFSIRGGFDEAKSARFRKAGRGEGEHATYEPWLRTHDVTALQSRKSKILGEKSQRLHHLFNDLECDAVTIIDWADCVTDIRERYPLDQEIVHKIAKDIGVRLPTDPKSRESHVVCADLFISLADGGRAARSIRSSSKLSNKAALGLLEVERLYWAKVGCSWGIITERDINDTHLHNVNFGRSHIDLTRIKEIDGLPPQPLAEELLAEITNSPHVLIEEICDRLDAEWRIPNQALFLFRHLVGTRRISCPPEVRLTTSLQAGQLIINRRRD